MIVILVFQEDIGKISSTLQEWCDNCDSVLGCIEKQVERANSMKEKHTEHKNDIEKRVQEIREQIKAKQQLVPDSQDDPDSRMDIDRERRGDKKAAKVKGVRGKASTWLK